MRIVFFGSGAFGLPTLEALRQKHEVRLVVTQPDRAAGRYRRLSPTPVGAYAADESLPCLKPENPNDPEFVETLRVTGARMFVVIAYGCKLSAELCDVAFAINLHASLLPKYRGAAPINWAMIHGDTATGVSVITLAERMDAGDVLARASLRIDPMETAGELHDRLAALGPDAVLGVIEDFEAGRLRPERQDPSTVSFARKLTKADAALSFDASARDVRNRIHGLTPWPGCAVSVLGQRLIVKRAGVVAEEGEMELPGTIHGDLTIACNPGRLRLVSVQPAGGKTMTFEAYVRGHRIVPGMRLEAAEHDMAG